jgi:protein PhnA
MTPNLCELCSASKSVSSYEVGPNSALLCQACQTQCHDLTQIDVKHWYCLRESIWSENPAVKILAWRILTALSEENWAQDLLDQLYLDEDLLSIAKEGIQETQTSEAPSSKSPRDSNGTPLAQGDSVTLIKDLEVKGAGFTAKRGTLVKNIVLTEDSALIEGRVNGSTIVLKTCFLKKA